MTDLRQLTILIVEDENDLRRETAAFLELYFRNVYQAAEGRQAMAVFDSEKPDMVITDIRMPIMDGIELATCLKKSSPDTPIVFCTAFTETDYLLKAIELQVAAFVRKPVQVSELIAGLTRAAEPVLLRRQIGTLSSELTALVDGQLGRHPLQQAVAAQVVRVAPTTYNVLLQGETGTGKSRLASIIHSLSPRRDKPFVTIQLSTVPIHLSDSLLFGHLKGAFTGADRSRAGLVEAAESGTLFLDDIESCHAGVQAKLLRMVEQKSFTPVGSNVEKRHDVRIISASNRDLKEEAEAGRFREDLYTKACDMLKHLMSGLPDDSLEQKLKTYTQPDILLIDELGFDRIEQQAAHNASLFFKVIDARYGKSSTWMTTNIGFEALGDYLGDPVVTTSIVDRMVHHAIIISVEGPSYRIHESKKLNRNHEKSNGADP